MTNQLEEVTNQLEERPRASEEKMLAIVGLVLAVVGAVPVIVDLKSAVAKFVGVLIAVVLAALLLRGLRLWSRKQLDPFLAVLIVLFTLCTLIPLAILSSKDGKVVPPSGTGGNLLTTKSPALATAPTGSTTSPSSSARVDPETAWLVDQQPVVENSKGWTTKPVQVKGATYTKALAVRSVWCDSIQLDYALGGQYARFKALVGMADDSPEITPLNFYVLADGKVVKKISEVGIAAPQEVDLPMTGVSRLAIGIEKLDREYSPTCPGAERVGVWIDPSLSR